MITIKKIVCIIYNRPSYMITSLEELHVSRCFATYISTIYLQHLNIELLLLFDSNYKTWHLNTHVVYAVLAVARLLL